MRRQDIFRRTRWNIIGMSMGIVMGALIVFALITEVIFSRIVFSSVDEKLLTHKNMILREAHITPHSEGGVEVIFPAPLVKELMSYVWDDTVLIKESPHAYKGSSQYPNFPSIVNDQSVEIKDEGYHYRGIQFMMGEYTVQLLLNVEAEADSLIELRKALIGAFTLLFALVLVVSFYLAKLTLRPLYKTYHKQARFIQDASHEMRTPLAILRGQIEVLVRKRHATPDEQFEILAGMMSELKGIERMNKDLLMISKEDMQGILSVKEMKLSTLMKEIVQLYSDLAKVHELDFVYEGVDEDLVVWWDIDKVRRCMNILLENAIKYTKAPGVVRVVVTRQERKIIVSIIDTGQGIKAEELTHVFERFYRSKEVRASGIEGSGIGLSLLQSLAYTMGVKVKVQSCYGEGSHFTLQLPIKMAQ